MTDTPTAERINQLLSEAYTEEGCRIWWSSPNRHMSRMVPAWLWLFGTVEDRDQVQREAERVAGGTW